MGRGRSTCLDFVDRGRDGRDGAAGGGAALPLVALPLLQVVQHLLQLGPVGLGEQGRLGDDHRGQLLDVHVLREILEVDPERGGSG